MTDEAPQEGIPGMDLSRCSQEFLISMVSNQFELITELKADRDRYHEALHRIATIRLKGYEAQRIAREAIKEQP